MSNSWLIGQAKECDLQVNSVIVSPHHCRLTRTGSRYLLEDLNSTLGTVVNGTPIDEPVYVSTTDTVLLAGSIPMPWPTEADQNNQRGKPVGTATNSLSISIGRDPNSDRVFDAPNVSWHHATLIVTGNTGGLIDLDSANGTFVGSLKNRIKHAKISR